MYITLITCLTGSEDGTIKIWAADGMNDLIQTLSEKVAITCLCIDSVNGAIVAGLQSTIKLVVLLYFYLVLLCPLLNYIREMPFIA